MMMSKNINSITLDLNKDICYLAKIKVSFFVVGRWLTLRTLVFNELRKKITWEKELTVLQAQMLKAGVWFQTFHLASWHPVTRRLSEN